MAVIDNEPDPMKAMRCFEYPMHFASIYRDVEAIQNGDPNDINKVLAGFTPLMLAVSNPNRAKYEILYPVGDTRVHDNEDGHLEITRLLLKRGADVNYANYNGVTALHSTCRDGALIELVKALVEYGANVNATDCDGQTAMKYLTMHGNDDQYEVTRFLLAHGADPFLYDTHTCTVVDEAVKSFPILRAIVDHGINLMDDRLIRDNQSTLLHHACIERTTPAIIDLVVGAGYDVNAQDNCGQTPLHTASCWKVHPLSTIKSLLKYSPDVSLVDNLGQSAFHFLCKNECILMKYFEETIVLLKEAGVDINQGDIFGQTPLYVALHSRHAYRVDCLIRQGASLTVLDKNGTSLAHHICLHNTHTALLSTDGVGNDKFGSSMLHYAAYSNNLTASKKLIELGMRVDAKDKLGRTPLDIALSHGFIAVATILARKEVTSDVYPCRSKCIRLNHSDIESGDFSAIEQPDDVQVFSQRVLASPVIGKCQDTSERKAITTEITGILNRLSEDAGVGIPFLAFEPKVRGSMAEGTKCGPPDEFDCMIILHKLANFFTPEIEDRFGKAKYTRLMYNAKDGGEFKARYPYFIAKNGMLNSMLLSMFIHDKFLEIFSQREFWNESLVSFSRFEKTSNFLTVLVKWTGGIFKDLEIGVDLVPSIPISFDSAAYEFSWPLPIDLENASLYALMVQSSQDDELLEVSFTEIEERMMHSLPPQARDAYIFAKGMRSPQVSHEIQNFDTFDDSVGSIPCGSKPGEDSASTQKASWFTAETFIKSYYLKCQLFWLVKEMAPKMDIHGRQCHEWTQMIYKDLRAAVERHELLTYIQGHNVLDSKRRLMRQSLFRPAGRVWRLERMNDPERIQKTPVVAPDDYVGKDDEETMKSYPKQMMMLNDERKLQLILKIICHIIQAN